MMQLTGSNNKCELSLDIPGKTSKAPLQRC